MSETKPERFQKFLTILVSKDIEGGYVNDPLDPGGPTNLGVTQETYTAWLTKKKKKNKNVKIITHQEAEQIYFEEYYSRLAYIENELAHYLVFDLAVNSGVGRARECIREVQNPHNPANILTWRRQYYNKIVAEKPTQKRFLPGWLGRLKFIEKSFEE